MLGHYAKTVFNSQISLDSIIVEAAPFWNEIMFKMFKKCKIKKVGFQKVKNLV
jgi:hypothetical protein